MKRRKKSKKSWIERIQAKLTLMATILGLLITIFALKDRIIRIAPSSRFQTKVVDIQTNVGVPNVIVVLTEVDGKHFVDTTKTSFDGSFLIKVKSKPGTKIRLNFVHEQYKSYDAFYETENPKIIKLERKEM